MWVINLSTAKFLINLLPFSKITLVFSNIKFELNAEGQTEFSYELTLNIFQTETDVMGFAAHDDDLDGIDFAYIDYISELSVVRINSKPNSEGFVSVTSIDDYQEFFIHESKILGKVFFSEPKRQKEILEYIQ